MKNRNSKIVILFLSVAGLSACGTNGVSEKGATAQAQNNVTTTPTPVPVNTGFSPTYPSRIIQSWGTETVHTTATPEIDADLNMKLRISASNPTQITLANLTQEYIAQFGTYSNYVANYDCIRYKVFVDVKNSSGQWVLYFSGVTPYLTYGGGNCQGAPADQIKSSTILNVNLPVGHGAVRARIAGMDSNHYCKWIGMWNRCPTYSVYQTHVVNANIELQTDTGYDPNSDWASFQ